MVTVRVLGLIGLLLCLVSCAGPHEPPKAADLLFSIPWQIKRYRAGTFYQDIPPQASPTTPTTSAPATEER